MVTRPIEDSWTPLSQGRYQEAALVGERLFAQTGTEADLVHCISAILLLRDIDSALAMSMRLLRFTNGRRDSDFISVGICKWLLGDKHEALQLWQQASGAPYQDIAGGFEPLGFALFGACVLGDAKVEANSLKQLRAMVKRNKRGNVGINAPWPVPLAFYLTGEIDEVALSKRIEEGEPPNTLRLRARCQACFYLALTAWKQGDMAHVQQMRSAAEQLDHSARVLVTEYYLLKLWDGWETARAVCPVD